MESAMGTVPECGAIFMSNNETRKECLRRRLFGLPSSQHSFVKLVKAGMILFLFEYESRRLYGVFQACSDGAMNIVPHAFSAFGKQFPAQVRIKSLWHCAPLSENVFRDAIKENYFYAKKFNFGLSEEQVRRLLSLFRTRILKVNMPGQQILGFRADDELEWPTSIKVRNESQQFSGCDRDTDQVEFLSHLGELGEDEHLTKLDQLESEPDLGDKISSYSSNCFFQDTTLNIRPTRQLTDDGSRAIDMVGAEASIIHASKCSVPGISEPRYLPEDYEALRDRSAKTCYAAKCLGPGISEPRYLQEDYDASTRSHFTCRPVFEGISGVPVAHSSRLDYSNLYMKKPHLEMKFPSSDVQCAYPPSYAFNDLGKVSSTSFVDERLANSSAQDFVSPSVRSTDTLPPSISQNVYVRKDFCTDQNNFGMNMSRSGKGVSPFRVGEDSKRNNANISLLRSCVSSVIDGGPDSFTQSVKPMCSTACADDQSLESNAAVNDRVGSSPKPLMPVHFLGREDCGIEHCRFYPPFQSSSCAQCRVIGAPYEYPSEISRGNLKRCNPQTSNSQDNYLQDSTGATQRKNVVFPGSNLLDGRVEDSLYSGITHCLPRKRKSVFLRLSDPMVKDVESSDKADHRDYSLGNSTSMLNHQRHRLATEAANDVSIDTTNDSKRAAVVQLVKGEDFIVNDSTSFDIAQTIDDENDRPNVFEERRLHDFRRRSEVRKQQDATISKISPPPIGASVGQSGRRKLIRPDFSKKDVLKEKSINGDTSKSSQIRSFCTSSVILDDNDNSKRCSQDAKNFSVAASPLAMSQEVHKDDESSVNERAREKIDDQYSVGLRGTEEYKPIEAMLGHKNAACIAIEKKGNEIEKNPKPENALVVESCEHNQFLLKKSSSPIACIEIADTHSFELPGMQLEGCSAHDTITSRAIIGNAMLTSIDCPVPETINHYEEPASTGRNDDEGKELPLDITGCKASPKMDQGIIDLNVSIYSEDECEGDKVVDLPSSAVGGVIEVDIDKRIYCALGPCLIDQELTTSYANDGGGSYLKDQESITSQANDGGEDEVPHNIGFVKTQSENQDSCSIVARATQHWKLGSPGTKPVDYEPC